MSTMINKAARKLCQRHAEECCVNEPDTWNAYSEMFISDAVAALEAGGAFELRRALAKLLEMYDSTVISEYEGTDMLPAHLTAADFARTALEATQ